MSTAVTNKLYRTFVKGLVTEASPLTFPPDTSYDEDNCLIFPAGNRSRRLGIDYEDDFQYSDYSVDVADQATVPLTEYVWKNVNNIPGLDFLVHQFGSQLAFFDVSETPSSTNRKNFYFDLADYFIADAVAPEEASVQMATGKGFLFVVSEAMDPAIIEYDPITDSISSRRIEILIRDFDGVEDEIATESEPSTLTALHQYNLENQGWYTDTSSTVTTWTRWGTGIFAQHPVVSTSNVNVIQKYKDVIGRYPGNNKQWFLGKVEAAGGGYAVGDFNPELLNKVHVGNSRAPRGHFIFSAFNKDRSAVSGIVGIDIEKETTRPSTICFSSGRIFYGHNNTVYFSQILSSQEKAGLCFQDNDPTAEDISDLLANDGGVIPIPAADKIILTKEVSNGIMVFANNGVWFISGGDKGFSAIDYQVAKISAYGTDSPYSVVDTQNHIYFWSKVGILRIEQQTGPFGAVQGSFQATNLTENTIDSLIKDISTLVRKYIKGVYDHGTNTIHWLYATNDLGLNFFYNRLLNYNVITESFFPWSLVSGNYPYITGIYLTSDINRISNAESMTINGDDVVINGEAVVTNSTTLSAKDSFVQFIVAASTGSIWQFTIANFTNDNYVDWESFDDTGIEYESFVETGYEILEDAARKKQLLSLHAFFRQTEENFVADGDDYNLDKPSSCYLTTKWDWSNSSASNRWSTRTQAYRLKRVPLVNVLDLSLNTGFKIVTTRHKIRGHGRSLQFKFGTDERGKNFDLYGWQAFYTGNTED